MSKEIAELSGGTFRSEVHDVLASDEHVVGLILARAERDGRIVELPRVHIWHVRDGKLSELWLHPTKMRSMLTGSSSSARRALRRYWTACPSNQAERWCDNWEAEVTHQGIVRDRDYRDAGGRWIEAQRAARRTPLS